MPIDLTSPIDVAVMSEPDMSVVRSIGSFVAIAISVMDAALMVKNLHGNQSLRCRKPWKTSAAIAKVQMRDATATYNPTHGMASFGECQVMLLHKENEVLA
ncbi:hypothetical protein L6452_29117 [Arctium lappa]|uniref:Uncharacterized protein n=1 Tax=Arctium lappa TaxID=4217 RepID=A0ACB8ZFT7_ARCLA|nr:hypothetical protein L6452_29117 [Arctium lappa]